MFGMEQSWQDQNEKNIFRPSLFYIQTLKFLLSFLSNDYFFELWNLALLKIYSQQVSLEYCSFIFLLAVYKVKVMMKMGKQS